MHCEHRDVALPQVEVAELLPHELPVVVHEQLGHAVARRHAEPLPHIDLGERHLIGDVVDDRARDIQLRGRLDTLEARRRVDLHHERPVRALKHVDTGDPQPHDLGRAHRHLLVVGGELDRLHAAAAVHVRPELVALRRAPHGRDHAVADDEGTDVPPATLAHEPLDQHVLVRRVQRLDDRLGHLDLGGEDDADALSALEQLDHDRGAAHPLDRRPHVGPVAHEGGLRHGDVVPGQDLRRPQLVAGARDAVRGVRRVDIHLLELAHHGRAEVGDRVADARQDRVVVAERLAAVLQVGVIPGEVDREAQGVENPHLVAPLGCGRAQTLSGVRARRARQDREFHSGGPVMMER